MINNNRSEEIRNDVNFLKEMEKISLVTKLIFVREGQHTVYLGYISMQGCTIGNFVYGEADLTMQQQIFLVCQLIAAIHILHSRGICHRDLKPANILVSRDGKLAISDFSSARRIARRKIT